MIYKFRDSSSDEEGEEKIVKKKQVNKRKTFDSDNENGFLSDGYDVDFYGDAEDRARLNSITEVEREAILYERAQARQARQERRALEQRIREREDFGKNKRAIPKEVDLKRKKLDELKAKRQKKFENKSEDEEEGEFEDSDLNPNESESEDESHREIIRRKKSSKKHRNKKDSDEDYYTEDEGEENIIKKPTKFQAQAQAQAQAKQAQDQIGDELDLEMANKLRLTRDILAQWIYRDGFEEIVQKSLLRINLGPGKTGQPTYRLVELKKIVQHHRTYLIKPGTPTNLAAFVKFANNERIFSFEFVSNSPFTQSEFSYWKMECERAGIKLPYNSVTGRRKIEKFKSFNSEPLTDTLIQKMLERRKELTTAQNAPRNLLGEQTILQQQLKEALERNNNDDEINRIESELAAIASKRQTTESKDRLAAMEDLNKRNRQVNLETGRQAEITRMQAELPTVNNGKSENKAPTLDPFQRRKCKPTIIHMKEGEENEVVVEEAVEQPVNPVVPETSTNDKNNLFDAHNFDLDLDI